MPRETADAPILWLRADSGVDVASGTWVDLSGFGNHATQTPGTAVPTLTTTANGRPALNFARASLQFFNLPNAFQALTAAEIFIVLKAAAAANSSPPWTLGSSAAQSLYTFADGHVYDDFGSTSRKNTGVYTQDVTNWHIYGVSSTSGAWSNRVDGAQIFSTGTNTVGWSTTPRLGADPAATGVMDGAIAEVILFPRVASAKLRNDIQRYLASEYSLTAAP